MKFINGFDPMTFVLGFGIGFTIGIQLILWVT